MSRRPPTSTSSASRSEVKHLRRTATDVLAGRCDARPERDVLTSVLNGVPPYNAVEEREAGGKRAVRLGKGPTGGKAGESNTAFAGRAAGPAPAAGPGASASASAAVPASAGTLRLPACTPGVSGNAPRGRPAIHMPSLQRSQSVTPPPPIMPAAWSPMTTPGRSRSPSTGATSRTSSKRPRTPDDDEELASRAGPSTSPSVEKPPRKMREKARKGWKGWVEGSPPPSDKLINLDTVMVIETRRTRSGRPLA